MWVTIELVSNSYFIEFLNCLQSPFLASRRQENVSFKFLLEKASDDFIPDALVGPSDNCDFNHFFWVISIFVWSFGSDERQGRSVPVFDLLWKCGACTSCLNTYTMHLAYTMTPCICVYYDLFSLHVVQDFLVWRWSCFKTQMKLWTQNSVYSPSHPKISKQEIINVESLKTVAWRCLFLSLVQRNNHQTLSTYCIFVTNTSWTIRPEFTIKIFNAIFKKNYAFLYIIQRSY